MLRQCILAAALAVAFVASPGSGPALAGGFVKTKQQCTRWGGTTDSKPHPEYGYYCSTPKKDRECVGKVSHPSDGAACVYFDPKDGKCEFDDWGYDDDDC